jgi:prepilin-type N-terminal cleavage/methylation domain-containing protein
MRPYRHPTHRPGGFTLVELMVVVLIIVIVSAATLPVIIPAISHRQVSEGARLLQATLVGARDAAIRSNAPRGVRLLPDPAFPGPSPLAANRMIAIEPAPDYISGQIELTKDDFPTAGLPQQISISEALFTDPGKVTGTNTIPSEPTSWYWNIRQGDKIRFDDSGRYYTVAGPVRIGAFNDKNNTTFAGFSGSLPSNTERYVNFGPPGYVLNPTTQKAAVNDPNPVNGYSLTNLTGTHFPEILILVNGQDDDGDGWVDESFDGIDNDGDGITDPGYNGIDDNNDGVVDDPAELRINKDGEYEPETLIGSQYTLSAVGTHNYNYTIVRRPVVSPGAREVPLPQGVVIDMTTWNADRAIDKNTINFVGATRTPPPPERSRLPVDPYSYTVDILINPNGQVVPPGPGQIAMNSSSFSSPTSNLPFFHFWVTEREDVFDPLWGVKPSVLANANPNGSQIQIIGAPFANPNYTANPPQSYLLPMPKNSPNFTTSGTDGPFLKGDRRLVTLYVRTGLVITNEIEAFDGYDTSTPYYPAEFGTREAK